MKATLLAVIVFLTLGSALRGQTTFAFTSPSSKSGSQVANTLNGLSAGQASPGQFVEFRTEPSLTVNQRMAYSPINSGVSVKKDDKKVPSATPEPGTLVLFGTGMLGLLRAGRRGLQRQQ
jgi:PEP-CTERM motif